MSRWARLGGVEVEVVSADGTSLIARRHGDGPSVVLVHGSSGGLDSWDGVVPFLAEAFEVWVYARRGYAPSVEGAVEKTFTDDVADVRAVVEAAGGEAHLVGASYGATVCLHAVASNPSVMRSLAVFEPPLFASGTALLPVLESYESLVASRDLAGAARLFAEKVAQVPTALLNALAAPDDARPRSAPDAVDLAEAIGCLHDLQAMAADDTDITRWSDVDIPALLMQGSDSWPPIPATMERLATAMPSAARAVLEGQSHFATHTAPALFADHLLQFLSPDSHRRRARGVRTRRFTSESRDSAQHRFQR
jgi:pimeloyl-ACP methyl ester carboxylesterase